MSAENISELKLLPPDAFDRGFDSSSRERLQRKATLDLLSRVLADKGVDGKAVTALADAEVIGQLLDNYFLANYTFETEPNIRHQQASTLDSIVKLAGNQAEFKKGSYTGSIFENRDIIATDFTASDRNFYRDNRVRNIRRNGAARRFESELANVNREKGEKLGLPYVPVAVIGGGASGVLTARAIAALGFENVTVFDKSGGAGGIWKQDNVRLGTKNNPFDITYDRVRATSTNDLTRVEQSGLDIESFIEQIERGHGVFGRSEALKIRQANVKEIVPGDLAHKIILTEDGATKVEEFPIVVYAPGIGKPLPVNREGHMRSSANRKEVGIRWQQQLSEEKLRQLEGKRMIFVGLGNSTAEMLFQLQKYEDRTGRVIDYKVLTHYPNESLTYPNDEFGGYSSVFRDIDKPELTKLAGDLVHINDAYNQAYREGKIVSDVVDWHVESNQCIVTNKEGIKSIIPYDQMYTLIGYRQEPDHLRKMGIHVLDEYTGEGAFDYDGEVQRNPGATGRERIYPGYFAIGPIVKNRHNPNAIVIPGVQYQLSDLLTSVTLRAAEYAVRHPEQIRQHRPELNNGILLNKEELLSSLGEAALSGFRDEDVDPWDLR